MDKENKTPRRLKGGFEKLAKVVWILASDDGCVLAHGHPDPQMPPYHLDPLTDRLPAVVHAPNKITLGDAKKVWNGRVRGSGASRRVQSCLFVREHKVRITIEEA